MVEIDIIDGDDVSQFCQEFNIEVIRKIGYACDVRGDKKDIVNFLISDYYCMPIEEVVEIYPELF